MAERRFVLDIPRLHGPTPEELQIRWQEYRKYIGSLGGNLPAGAFRYAVSEAHNEYSHRLSPHDGWLERVTIDEPALGSRREQRSIRIVIELLTSYHDGRILFTYPRVNSYVVAAPREFEWPPFDVGHGDWLADEVRLADDGGVIHEILFSRGAVWRLEASDLLYEWLPLDPHAT